MGRFVLAISMAFAVIVTTARAESVGPSTGVSKSTVSGENGTVSKGSRAPSDGAGAPAPVKTQPLSRPQVRFAGYDLPMQRA